MTLRYRVSDDSGQAAVIATLRRGRWPLWERRSPRASRLAGTTYTFKWKAFAGLTGKLDFCVQGLDAYGNSSPERCAKVLLVR